MDLHILLTSTNHLHKDSLETSTSHLQASSRTFILYNTQNIFLTLPYITGIKLHIMTIIRPWKKLSYPRSWFAFIMSIKECIIIVVWKEVTDWLCEGFEYGGILPYTWSYESKLKCSSHYFVSKRCFFLRVKHKHTHGRTRSSFRNDINEFVTWSLDYDDTRRNRNTKMGSGCKILCFQFLKWRWLRVGMMKGKSRGITKEANGGSLRWGGTRCDE